MTADLDLPTGRETGPIFAIGGRLGGMGLSVRNGRPVFVMRTFDGEVVELGSTTRLPRGATRIQLDFVRPPARPLQPVEVSVAISANGKLLATNTFTTELPFTYSISETFDIGRDDGSAVSDSYKADTPLAATIRNVTFDFTQAGATIGAPEGR